MKYVDTPEALAEAEKLIARSKWASVDCEADSLHHYAEKLCLIQISVEDEDLIIDPLAKLDLVPMVSVLEARPEPLVLHGADFDLRMVKRASPAFSAKEIFDTLIAAQLLGYTGQGYADLVKRHIGIELSKSAQKADWSKRPLEDKLLDYASKDTHYLKPVSEKMDAELYELGRKEWHRQSCAKLVKSVQTPREERVRDGREWQIKGSRDLKGVSLTVLKNLWYWRDHEAQRRDRPSFKVVNTDVLIDVAKWAAENPGQDVATMPKAPSNVRRDYKDIMNRLIREAETGEQAVFTVPQKPRERKRWGNAESKRMDELKKMRDEITAPLKIHASLVSTNAMLEDVAMARPKTREALRDAAGYMEWQLDLVEEGFLKITNEI